MEKQEIDSYIKAGKIHQGVTAFAKSIIKPGMKLYDIAVAIDEKIDELGGEPAFPVNLSINEIAAHFTPAKDDEHVAEGLLKVDIGVAVDGFIADGAFSLDFSEGGKYGEMISLNEKILLEVEKVIKPGMEVCDVGDSVQDSLESWNSSNGSRYSVIKGLSGHQLGQNVIHAGVTISNYRNDNHKKLNDVAIAIEPFVTDGVGDIYEGPGGGIYVLERDLPVRDRESRELLKYIKEKFLTRPFCLRWLEKAGFGRLKFVIPSLVRQGILHHYPLLIEKGKGVVSQAENTFLICDGKTIISTKGNGDINE